MKNCLKYIAPALVSIIIMVVGYIADNAAVLVPDSMNMLSWTEYGIRYMFGDEEQYEDALFINTAYDKELAKVQSEESDEILGNGVVTDRNKLCRLLHTLDSIGNYRLIFLDIRFEKEYTTPYDSALYAQILSTPRIVVAHHSTTNIADSSLLAKTAYNDYYATIVATNFTRYQYLQSGSEHSIALTMHNILNKKDITKHLGGLYYTDEEGCLCKNSMFITNIKDFSRQTDDNGNMKWYNMGKDLKYLTSEELANLINNKLIFICNMVSDTHDTYAGMTPGAVITYKAYKNLEEGKHLFGTIMKVVSVLLLILYFVMAYYAMYGKQILPHFKSKIVNFICSFIGWGLVLYIISILTYIFLGLSFNTFVPTLVLTIMSLYNRYKRYEN